MQDEEKLSDVLVEQSEPLDDDVETGRVMDSIDRVNGAVLGTQRILSEKHFDADIGMEQEENVGIWTDSSLSTEEKLRLSQENHAFHNDQRIRAQKETMSASSQAADEINTTTGKIAATLKFVGSTVFGTIIGYAAGDAFGLGTEDKLMLAAAGGATGFVACTLANKEKLALNNGPVEA